MEDDIASTGKGSPELFTCGICTEPYDDNEHKAKFLTCYHTFCSQCLSQWHGKKGEANTSSIQCPNCDQLTSVPENGIAGLQTNFYIERMKENPTEAETPKPDGQMEGCQQHGNHLTLFFCTFFAFFVACIAVYIYMLNHKESTGYVKTGIKEATTAHNTLEETAAHSTLEATAAHSTLEATAAHSTLEATTAHSTLEETAAHSTLEATAARSTLEDQLLRSHAIQVEIQNAIQAIESEMQTIQRNRDSKTENLVIFIRFAQDQLEQCLQEATDAISQHHTIQHGKLVGKQWPLQQAAESLEKHISQSEEIVKTGNINAIISFRGNLEKATQKTKFHLDQRENPIKSELIAGPNLLNDRFHSIGQTYFKSNLPTNVVFRNDKITAGLISVITVELFNDAGNKFMFVPSFLTVKLIDPEQDELPVTLNTTPPDFTVTFTPHVSGKHEISVMCLGQKLKSEQTHIIVNSNNPVLTFGKEGDGNGNFEHPYNIVMDNNDVLYVADEYRTRIQTFSYNGKFLNKFFVNDHEGVSIVGMALDQENELIYCTKPSANLMLVFDLEGQLQHSYKLDIMIKPSHIAINRHYEIIISDWANGRLCKFNKQGKHLSCMGNLKLPGFIAISNDDSVIVADMRDDCVYAFSPDGLVRHKFGSSGTGKGQLKEPWGVATDGEYILVGDKGNNRIQVFRYNGTFVSMIESKDDPLLYPWGLLATGDGYVYVADVGNHCIKKYKYRHMS